MSVVIKANELAQELVRSQEVVALREAEAAMYSDENAKVLLAEYENIQKEIFELGTDTVSETIHAKLDELEKKIEGNPTIAVYIEAQEKVERMLQSINMIISKALNGSSSCSPSACSSCSSAGECN